MTRGIILEHRRRKGLRLELRRMRRRLDRATPKAMHRHARIVAGLPYTADPGDTCGSCGEAPLDGLLYYWKEPHEYPGDGDHDCARCIWHEVKGDAHVYTIGWVTHNGWGAPRHPDTRYRAKRRGGF